jgi:hypothetical protein
MNLNGDDALSGVGNDQEDYVAVHNDSGDHGSSKHRKRSVASYSDEDQKPVECRAAKSHRRSHRDRKRHKDKKHRRYNADGNNKYSDSEIGSSDDNSYDLRHRRKSHREERKHSKRTKDRSKDDREKTKRKKDKDRSRNEVVSSTPIFGQFGILKASDMGKMQRSFEIWLSEVHGVHISSSNIPKYELQQYFDTYREDFNTATLPHIKYYNYDLWELEEHNRLRQKEAKQLSNSSTALEDERNHAKKLQVLAKQREQAAMHLVAASMNSSKVTAMQHQKQLQAQMQVAFKLGDSEAYRKLKEKLQPLEK